MNVYGRHSPAKMSKALWSKERKSSFSSGVVSCLITVIKCRLNHRRAVERTAMQ